MDVLLGLAMLGVAVCIYFVPTYVAYVKSHANLAAIGTLNFLLGWTFVGWVVALVWAMSKPAVVTVVSGTETK